LGAQKLIVMLYFTPYIGDALRKPAIPFLFYKSNPFIKLVPQLFSTKLFRNLTPVSVWSQNYIGWHQKKVSTEAFLEVWRHCTWLGHRLLPLLLHSVDLHNFNFILVGPDNKAQNFKLF
jgi:hypothetical protein